MKKTKIKLGYNDKYFSELIQIENLPKINNAPDKEMWCNGIKWRRLLENNPRLKNILTKMGNEIFNDIYNINKDMYCAISFNGTFDKQLNKAYVYISGDSCLYFVDDVNKFNEGSKWLKSIKKWKSVE